MTETNAESFFRLFDPDVFSAVTEKLSAQRPWKDTVIVAMPPRSGSTALVSALANAGLATSIWEILNPRGPLPHLLSSTNATTFDDYLRRYHRDMGMSDHLIFKTAYGDFQFFCVEERYRMFSPVTFIFLHREDRLAQAYSLAKARGSGVWHLKTGSKSDQKSFVPTLKQVELNLELIDREVNNWREFFSDNEISPYEIIYEEMCSNPDGVIGGVYQHITGTLPEKELTMSYQILRNETDALALARYREQLNGRKEAGSAS